MSRSVPAATLALTALTLAAPGPAAAQRVTLTPCAVRGLDGDVRCATVRVPEDRAHPDRRQIDLAIVVASATATPRAADPFMLLAGGPGQAGTQMGPFATQAFARVREHRDIVLIDTRGTGRSNGLRCAMMRHAEDLGGASMFPDASVRQCRDSLQRVADLTQYTTAAIADDIEAVREALGAPQLNLYGTSYGSRVALVYLRRHPTSVRTIVLKAVAPPTLIAPMNYAEDAQRALGLLERDCMADGACAKMGSPTRNLERTLARAAAGEIRAAAPPGMGPSPDTITISRDAIAASLVGAMQSAGSRAQLPLLLRRAADGTTTPLAALVVGYRQALDQEISSGMFLSVSCGEDGRRIDLARARRDDGRTFLGSVRVRMLADACASWILPPETPGAYDPVRAMAPVLLVSGVLDPNTPPRHAEQALRTLPNGRHVLLQGVAHGWSNVDGCGAAFVADFVARASTAGLDVRCGARSSAPPFAVR
jgi:pimeloyl-ACP methyl ester carboxylesterase